MKTSIDAEAAARLIEALHRTLDELGALLAAGIGKVPTDIDISGVKWWLPKKAGGGPASPEDDWAYTFKYEGFNGPEKPEIAPVLRSLEEADPITVEWEGRTYELGSWGRDGGAVYRKKVN